MYERNGNIIRRVVETDEQTYSMLHSNYHRLHVSVDDGTIANDGVDTEQVTIRVVNGLDIANGTSIDNASILESDGEALVAVDGTETRKTLSNGEVSFDVTTTKSAGETIEVVAKTLVDHPAESDSVEIEVIQV